jgi:hypothetical protein
VLRNLAAFHALSGEKEKSILELKKAVHINGALKKLARTNTCLQSLWNDADFRKLVE